MWSMILLMSRLLGGHSKSAGRRPEKLGYNSAKQYEYGFLYYRLVSTLRLTNKLCSSRYNKKSPQNVKKSPKCLTQKQHMTLTLRILHKTH